MHGLTVILLTSNNTVLIHIVNRLPCFLHTDAIYGITCFLFMNSAVPNTMTSNSGMIMPAATLPVLLSSAPALSAGKNRDAEIDISYGFYGSRKLMLYWYDYSCTCLYMSEYDNGMVCYSRVTFNSTGKQNVRHCNTDRPKV